MAKKTGSAAKAAASASAATLTALPGFADLSGGLLREVDALVQWRTASDADVIVASGQWDGGELIAIVEGAATVTRSVPKTGEVDFSAVREGELLGLPQLLVDRAGPDPTLSVVASAPTVFARVEAEGFMRLIARRAAFARAVLRNCAHTALQQALASGQSISPERRVHRTLLDLVRPCDNQFVIDPMPGQKALADAAGVPVQTVADVIAALLAAGTVSRVFPALQVTNIDALRQLAR